MKAASASTTLLRSSGSKGSVGRHLSTVYGENATKILPLEVDATNTATRDQQLVRVLREICPSFFETSHNYHEQSSATHGVERRDDHTMTIQPLLGGLSNQLFVWKRPDSSSSVLFRIHPRSEVEIVNRETENRILVMLSQQGDAPLFYGRFANGRVEEFYDNHRPLSCREMNTYAAEIAALLARLHRKHVPPQVLTPTDDGHLWTRLEEWFHMASQQQPEQRRITTDSTLMLERLRFEWTWLQSVLRPTQSRCTTKAINGSADAAPTQRAPAQQAQDFLDEIVLTHMDCQSLNLLRPDSNDDGNESASSKAGPLRLIDFEYAGLNPRAADIANTFCEFCDMNNMRADYEREYPSEDVQNEFFRAYLKDLDSSSLLAGQQEEFLTAMRLHVGKYTVLSHLGWAVWSLVQHNLSDIEFDYLAYAQHRMDGYELFKAKFWR